MSVPVGTLDFPRYCYMYTCVESERAQNKHCMNKYTSKEVWLISGFSNCTPDMLAEPLLVDEHTSHRGAVLGFSPGVPLTQWVT